MSDVKEWKDYIRRARSSDLNQYTSDSENEKAGRIALAVAKWLEWYGPGDGPTGGPGVKATLKACLRGEGSQSSIL